MDRQAVDSCRQRHCKTVFNSSRVHGDFPTISAPARGLGPRSSTLDGVYADVNNVHPRARGRTCTLGWDGAAIAEIDGGLMVSLT